MIVTVSPHETDLTITMLWFVFQAETFVEPPMNLM